MGGADLRGLVLIIDADDELARTMAFYLEREGLRTRIAAAAADGVIAALDERPALIVLASDLPDRPGLELARVLRANPRTRSVKLLVCGRGEHDDDRVHAAEAGAHDYLAKPFGMGELVVHVTDLIRRVEPSAR